MSETQAPYDIDAMPAGREMDALVAEKAMEFRFEHRIADGSSWLEAGTEWYALVAPDGIVAAFNLGTEWQGWGIDFPYYSIDIAAAWKVADKLRIAIIPAFQDADCPQLWIAGQAGATTCYNYKDTPIFSYYEVDLDSRDVWATAPTVPLAICRAALKAVMK